MTHLKGGFYNMRHPGRSGGTGVFVCRRLGGRERVFRGLPARAAKGTCHEPGVLVGYAWMCRSRNEQLPGDTRGAVAGLPPNTSVAPAYQEAGFWEVLAGGPMASRGFRIKEIARLEKYLEVR